MKAYVKVSMILLIMTSLNLTGQGESKDSPTRSEVEAAIYCNSCFDILDQLDAQQRQLKVQVESRGVIINESKATIGTMRILLDRMRDQYYLSEKAAKKAKRRAWFRGVGLGIGVGAGIVVGFVISTGQ